MGLALLHAHHLTLTARRVSTNMNPFAHFCYKGGALAPSARNMTRRVQSPSPGLLPATACPASSSTTPHAERTTARAPPARTDSVADRRAHLSPSSTSLPAIHVPHRILASEGVYINLLGCETDPATRCVYDTVKIGESSNIAVRNASDHAKSAKHSRLVWGACPLALRCTSRKMEKSLKRIAVAMASERPADITILPGRNHEEYRVSQSVTASFIGDLIARFTHVYGRDVDSSHYGQRFCDGAGGDSCKQRLEIRAGVVSKLADCGVSADDIRAIVALI